MNILIKSKLIKSSRIKRLAAIILRFLDGRLDARGLENELIRLYDRQGEARTSAPPWRPANAVSMDGRNPASNASMDGRNPHQPTNLNVIPGSTRNPASNASMDGRNPHQPTNLNVIPGSTRNPASNASMDGRVTHRSETFQKVKKLITQRYPLRSPADLRPDQLEAYADTVAARASAMENLDEYRKRGTQYVQVKAIMDGRTTTICRSMHNRVFALQDALEMNEKQELLAQPNSFWEGNQYFAQTPTPEIDRAWMPPYHYNCRSRVVPFTQPRTDAEAAILKHENLVPLKEKDIQAIVDYAGTLDFADAAKKTEHFSKHRDELKVRSEEEMMLKLMQLLENPLKKMGLAVSARDNKLNLYVWDPKEVDGKHEFIVFALDTRCVKTYYMKTEADIEKNFSEANIKASILTGKHVKKGAKMVDELDVKHYEYIIDYFKNDDSCDELEMFSRLRFDEEWEGIPEHLKKRILAVDKIVLERFHSILDYPTFNKYIACIRARVKREESKHE